MKNQLCGFYSMKGNENEVRNECITILSDICMHKKDILGYTNINIADIVNYEEGKDVHFAIKHSRKLNVQQVKNLEDIFKTGLNLDDYSEIVYDEEFEEEYFKLSLEKLQVAMSTNRELNFKGHIIPSSTQVEVLELIEPNQVKVYFNSSEIDEEDEENIQILTFSELDTIIKENIFDLRKNVIYNYYNTILDNALNKKREVHIYENHEGNNDCIDIYISAPILEYPNITYNPSFVVFWKEDSNGKLSKKTGYIDSAWSFTSEGFGDGIYLHNVDSKIEKEIFGKIVKVIKSYSLIKCKNA